MWYQWDGCLSRPITVRQGVGQGRILTPTLYKIYMNGVLQALKYSGAGIYIGTEYIGSSTVADVLLIDQHAEGLQTIPHVSKNESNKRRYIIHPTKSETTSAKGPQLPMLL